MRDDIMTVFQEVADLPPSARTEYYARKDVPPGVRDEVESLLQFDTRSASLTSEIAKAAQEVVEEGSLRPARTIWGRYRVVRKLGSGGMGTVYLAERVDGEVEQKVALKVVRAGADVPGFQERFLAERRILASLSHPGIARLLDAGHSVDNEPYLAMEYVDGVPIDRYCVGQDLRSVLKLFTRVCDAVSYAHRSLIIHRDLKPSNILIDSAGQPKLLDFGIAKILDSAVETGTTMHALTPDYASPEQVRGEAHGTATDIYSLAAVLHKLIYGAAPGKTGAMAVSSSGLTKEVPRDVQFMLRKALRAEPEERYATVDAFAADIAAFLDNRPVSARAGNTWYRARKFMRRYWVPLTAAAGALIGLSAGMYLANRERVIAEQRFTQVRQLANRVFDIDAAIRNTPGTVKARQLIVSTSLEYLRKLGAEARMDKDLALEVGSAYVQLAHVQGVPVNSNLGQFAQANESLRQADTLVGFVLSSDAKNRRALLASATIAHDRMVVAGVQNQHAESLAYTTDAAAKLDRFSALGNLDFSETKEVAFMYSNVAVTFVDEHRLDEAIRYAKRSVEIAKLRNGTGGQQSLAYGILADALRQSGELEAALSAVRESRRFQEQLKDTGQTWQKANLALALWREGSILAERGDISLGREQEAIPVFRRAADLAGELLKEDADDVTHRQLAGEVARRLADLMLESDARAALAVYDSAIRSMREAKTANATLQRSEASLLAGSSYALRAVGREAEAGQRVDEALRLLGQAGDYPNGAVALGSELDFALRALADHYAASRQPGKAAVIYGELVTKSKGANRDPKEDLRNAVFVSDIYAGQARVLRQDGRVAEAAASESARLDLWKLWDSKLPHNEFVRRQLAAVHQN